MVVQTHAGSMSHRSASCPDLSYIAMIALCMIRVYALWGRSRYILGLLLTAGTMSIVTASVCLFFPQTPRWDRACLTIFLKAALLASSRVGGETLPVISSFAGCSQFTPTVGYVADPTCDVILRPVWLTSLLSGRGRRKLHRWEIFPREVAIS